MLTPLHRRLLIVTSIVLFFAFVYYSIHIIFPRNKNEKPHFYTQNNSPRISFLDALFFSLVTQSTVGYGSTVPLSNIAKCVVAIQVMSTLFMIIYLSTQIL